MKIGDRVELHPGMDLWMRGARFGVVTKVIPGKQVSRSGMYRPEQVNVRMDHAQIRKVVRCWAADLTVIE